MMNTTAELSRCREKMWIPFTEHLTEILKIVSNEDLKSGLPIDEEYCRKIPSRSIDMFVTCNLYGDST